MQSIKSTTEMLDEFYRKLEEKEEKVVEEMKFDKKSNSLEVLLNDYEKHMEDKEKEKDRENDNERSANNEISPRAEKKASVKQILQLCKGEVNESLLMRVVNICLANKRVIELLHILIETENDSLIERLFSKINPVELGDYEDCLFILADYLTRPQYKLDSMFKYLSFSVDNGIYTLYPIFSLLMRKLVKAARMEETIILLTYMMHNRLEISTCSINFFIETLCKQERVEEAQTYFSKFQEYKPLYTFPADILEKCKFSKLLIKAGINIITWGTLIKCLCKSNNMELALYHYENLKELNIIEDEVIFNLLIDGCSKTSNLDRLKHIYFDMLSLKVTPTIVTFNTIIDAYIRAKDVNSAWQIYEDIISKGVQPDNFTYSTLFRGIRHKSHREFLRKALQIIEDLGDAIDVILINVLLDSCISMREDRLIVELFEKVKSNKFKKIQPDIITYNTFIKGCAQMNLFEKANEAFEYMFNQSEVMPNDVTFNTMIDVCVRSNNMPKVWTIIEKMKNVGIKPDNFTYSTIIKGLNKNTNLNFEEDDKSNSSLGDKDQSSELELAFKLFENVKKFSKPDEILYNCIMDACLRFDKIDKMLELYDQMLIEKIKPSSITCGIIIKAYGMKGNVDKALEIYGDMKRNYIEISSITYGCLINACIRNDNLAKAFEIYEELGANKIEMNIVLYTTLIKAYSRIKDINKVLEIFNKMKRDKNNAPNNVTYNSVIDCCIKCDKSKLAENILEEMCTSGIKPDIITFSTMIKGCLKKAELNQAIDYLNRMQKFDIKPDEVLLNSLLDGCEKMKKYSKAVEIFSYVRRFGVEPSMMSFSIMMKIYGKLNDFNSSKALLDEVKKKNKNISLIIFTCYMKTCFTTGNVEEAMAIYNLLKGYKLTPDSITFSTMLSGLLANPDSKTVYITLVLKESLKMNIMVNEKLYHDALRRLSTDKENEELKEVTQMLGDAGINIDLNSKSQIKSEGNINFLINSYKHKKHGGNYNTKGRKNANPKNNNYQNKKERSFINPNSNLLANNENKRVQEKTNPSPMSGHMISPYSNFEGNSNVNTGSNYNNFYMKNYKFYNSEFTKGNSTTTLSMDTFQEGRSKFLNSKKEIGIGGAITPGQYANFSYSPYNTSQNPSATTDKDGQTVKNKKFNRF